MTLSSMSIYKLLRNDHYVTFLCPGYLDKDIICVQSYQKQSSTVELLRIITDRVDSIRKEYISPSDRKMLAVQYDGEKDSSGEMNMFRDFPLLLCCLFTLLLFVFHPVFFVPESYDVILYIGQIHLYSMVSVINLDGNLLSHTYNGMTT
jgi:hypothetical protein